MIRQKVLSVVLVLITLAGVFCAPAIGVYGASSGELDTVIKGIVDWKKGSMGIAVNDALFSAGYLPLAGMSSGDWYPIGMGRYGYVDNYNAYVSAVTAYVTKKYGEKNKLDGTKATEWHRISLAIIASGGNPRNVGGFDLIADGTYNRGLTASVGKQGINGWIWALITLDSLRFEVPDDAYQHRRDFITELLKLQLENGGFSLTGVTSDPDVTAMAIVALAPYYNSSALFEYTSSKIKADGEFVAVKKKVSTVVDEALGVLSALQGSGGDYSSYGSPNAESTAWVMLALLSLGVDPLTDPRFTKNGNNLYDGILKYRTESGAFAHSYTVDPNNLVAIAGKPNSAASETVLYALVALSRYQNGQRFVFDMRAEFTEGEKSLINSAVSAIAALDGNSSLEEVEAALETYKLVDSSDSVYVHNFDILRALAESFSLELPADEVLFKGSGNVTESDILLYFSPSHTALADEILALDKVTTAEYSDLLELLYVLEKCFDFDGRAEYIASLTVIKQEIEAIYAEIDAIVREIAEKLYPFEAVGLSDKALVAELRQRYEALSEFDRYLVDDELYLALLKAETKIKNINLAIIFAVVCAVLVALSLLVVTLGVKRRIKKKHESAMTESDE